MFFWRAITARKTQELLFYVAYVSSCKRLDTLYMCKIGTGGVVFQRPRVKSGNSTG